MKQLAAILSLALLALPMQAEVVRPAPVFLFASANGKRSSLKSLRGQPVVLVVAKSPRSGKFRKQVKQLDDVYRKYASRDVVFIAAFTESDDRAKSDIPFTYAANPAQTAADYGSDGDFRLAVIGIDGNLDLVTSDIKSPEYVLSVINNGYPVQKRQREQ